VITFIGWVSRRKLGDLTLSHAPGLALCPHPLSLAWLPLAQICRHRCPIVQPCRPPPPCEACPPTASVLLQPDVTGSITPPPPLQLVPPRDPPRRRLLPPRPSSTPWSMPPQSSACPGSSTPPPDHHHRRPRSACWPLNSSYLGVQPPPPSELQISWNLYVPMSCLMFENWMFEC
jgi:hypothetical protein